MSHPQIFNWQLRSFSTLTIFADEAQLGYAVVAAIQKITSLASNQAVQEDGWLGVNMMHHATL